MDDDRLRELRQWLARDCGLDLQSLRPASEDASFRRYFRVGTPAGSRIAMDAPPSLEDTEPFARIAGWLEGMGLNAPRVLAADRGRGFLLLTDLGEESYLARLDAEPASAGRLYAAAIDALATLQSRGRNFAEWLPTYDAALLDREMALFRDWLCERHLQLVFAPADVAAWDRLTEALRANALEQPRVFVHRDYHSRNLMVTAAHPPGILDFQDAVWGPVTYDLVSLLKDCYIAWPRARVAGWVEDYRAVAGEAGIDLGEPDRFLRRFDLMGVQRHLKAAGIFARLWHRDGKPGYLGDVPRTLAYISAAEEYPELEWLRELIAVRIAPRLADRAPSPR